MIDGVRMRRAASAGVLAMALLAAACSTEAGGGEPEREHVTLVTDKTWDLPDTVRSAFERQTGLELRHRKDGFDSDALVAKLAKGEMSGDVVLGIETATVNAALSADVLVPYTSPEANKGQQRYSVDRQQRLSAVDRLIACVNVDDAWFAERNEPPPTEAADLTSSKYARLLAAPNPESSLEGIGFLHWAVARQGTTGWRPFMSKLKAGGALFPRDLDEVVAKYYTATAEDGDRPLTVGPATLPDTLAEQDGDSETSVLPDTCHEQVRYAGLLAKADSTQRAGKLLDFLLKQEFQQAVPELYGTFPARDGVELPDGWAAGPEDPTTLSVDAADLGGKRWIDRWIAVMAP